MTTRRHDSASPSPTDDRAVDLMIRKATEGLDFTSETALDAFLAGHPGLEREQDRIEHTVALVDQAFAIAEAGGTAGGESTLPPALQAQLMHDAGIFFDDPLRLEGRTPVDRSSASSAGAWAGWMAAAAALALAAVGWLAPTSEPLGGVPPRQFAQRVDRSADAVRCVWEGQVPSYEGVSGEIIWSDRLQQGYMRLVNLPVNDPAQQQYQLWIVDPAVDTNPVDGGVFDMPRGALEAVIPIDAKLAVNNPSVFAITLERPGGVVVSRGPLLVVASAAG